MPTECVTPVPSSLCLIHMQFYTDRFPWNGLKVFLVEFFETLYFWLYFDRWLLIWPLVIAAVLTVARVFVNFVILKVSVVCGYLQ